MLYIFICFIVYVILGLFFWSLCAMSQESQDKFVRRFKCTPIQKDMSEDRYTNIRCQAYTIQSLYSQDFIVPEVSHINYTFRNPLPSFEEKCGNSTASRDFNSQTTYAGQIDAIRHGHITIIHETWQLPSPKMRLLSVNGKNL